MACDHDPAVCACLEHLQLRADAIEKARYCPPDARDFLPGTEIQGDAVTLPDGLWALRVSDLNGKPIYRGIISSMRGKQTPQIPFIRRKDCVRLTGGNFLKVPLWNGLRSRRSVHKQKAPICTGADCCWLERRPSDDPFGSARKTSTNTEIIAERTQDGNQH